MKKEGVFTKCYFHFLEGVFGSANFRRFRKKNHTFSRPNTALAGPPFPSPAAASRFKVKLFLY